MTEGPALLVVVSGPSGVGKSTIVRRILAREPGIVLSTSVTTRAPRGGERNGEDYIFVSEEEFTRRRDAGELLEWAVVHGNRYGTPASFVTGTLAGGRSVLLEIDVQGGLSVKEKMPGAVLIFIVPPSWDVLEKRLRGRKTDDPAVIERRLENARREIGYSGRYDYAVVNDTIERCVEDVRCIIRAESLGTRRAAGGDQGTDNRG